MAEGGDSPAMAEADDSTASQVEGSGTTTAATQTSEEVSDSITGRPMVG